MKKKEKTINYEERDLLFELSRVQNDLAAAYSNFENATDPDLIDSYIFEVNSVQKRYKFLLQRAKEINLESQFQISNCINI